MTSTSSTSDETVDRMLERRVDLVAHVLRVGIGLALLLAAWSTDIAGDQQVAFTIFVVALYLPLSPVDYLLTPRLGGRIWFDSAIAAGHTTSIFAIAWLLPSLQAVVLMGYLVLVVVFTTNSGRRMGFVVSVFAGPLAVIANLLAPSEDELSWGVIAAFVAICLSITVLIDAVTAERALKARELATALAAEQSARRRAESAKAAKDRFVEAVTHELRTPLAVILAAIAMLDADDGNDADTVRTLVATARRRSQDLDRILTQVMEYTDVETRFQGEPRHVDIGPILQRLAAIDDRVTTTSADDSSECVVWADAGAVERVLGLVIDNAVKFSAPTTVVEVGVAIEQGAVCIEVTDRGRGIDAGDLERVFEPFQQSGEILPGTMGIGVGLTLARRLCEHYGGSIELQSEPGVGTAALVRFPR